MSPSHLWSLVHAERTALIEDLDGVDEKAWTKPSPCQGWTVGDVIAHLVDNARTTRTGFAVGLVRARFDVDRLNARGVRREGGRSPQETLQRLRRGALRTSTPPAPLDSRLVEEVVHGEDVRQPLGITRAYPVEAVTRALAVQAKTPAALGGAREVTAEVELVAADAPLCLGVGPAVRGPALSLLLAVCGRREALDDLEGPGVATLAGMV